MLQVNRAWEVKNYIFVHVLNFSEKYFTKRDGVVEEMEETSGKLKKDEEEDFGPGKFAKYQKLMWDLIEKPDTSLAAKWLKFYSFNGYFLISNDQVCQHPQHQLRGCLYRRNDNLHHAAT